MKKKNRKNRAIHAYQSKKAKKLMRDYRMFGIPQGGQAVMLSSSGVTAPVYNLTASALRWN